MDRIHDLRDATSDAMAAAHALSEYGFLLFSEIERFNYPVL
jgi:hypothetical protein